LNYGEGRFDCKVRSRQPAP